MSDKITTHTQPTPNIGGSGLAWPTQGPKPKKQKERDKKRGR